MPGPVPKRSDQRRRRNKDESGPVTKATTAAKPPAEPRADANWHPVAKEWFISLGKSGQSQFYEPSDWALAKLTAEMMDRLLRQGDKPSAVMYAAIQSAMTDLLTTEGARRRARVELEREAPVAPPSVAIMESYRRAAGQES